MCLLSEAPSTAVSCPLRPGFPSHWQRSEKDITLTNETLQTLDELGKARKVRSRIVQVSVRMCV